jgi:toxin YoeB
LTDKVRQAVFQPEFLEDLRYWVETDRKVALRAFDLNSAILRDPFTGIGKPEPLKYFAGGAWFRRLTRSIAWFTWSGTPGSIFYRLAIIIKAFTGSREISGAPPAIKNNGCPEAFQNSPLLVIQPHLAFQETVLHQLHYSSN